MTNKFYITTPLYYVNAKPHIGHAYTNIICDMFARYYRLSGRDVFFMTGTDEHGTKIAKTAREQGKEPKAYVDEMVPHFKELWRVLGIQYDYFIRTTDESHQEVVQGILKSLEAKGEIYKEKYVGWYSIKSETFYEEEELADGRCPDSGGEVQKIEEENYFFKMSKYQDWLISYINEHPDFIRPEMRKNEVLGFLRQPLRDLCITRPKERLEWGIPYPGSKAHVIYVWFDALINYISGIGYLSDKEKFASLWPADTHVVGKDILRHHAVYWPIMLKAIGVEMPKTILAHGWWTLAGAKVSKSTGNIVDPILLVKKYGVDAFRFFLLHEVTIGFDGAYSEDLLRERYNRELANDLGNLWFRFVTMLTKYCGGKIPALETEVKKDPLLDAALDLWAPVDKCMSDFEPRKALDLICGVIVRANQYIEEKKPWVMAKDASKKNDLEQTLWVIGESLGHLAFILRPFMPDTAQKILERMKLDKVRVIQNETEFRETVTKKHVAVERGEALFPKFEE